MVLSLYTNAAEDRDAVSVQLRAMFAAVIPATGTPGSEVLEWDLDPIVDVDPNAGEIYRKIHFGYTDGASNPLIDAPAAVRSRLAIRDPRRRDDHLQPAVAAAIWSERNLQRFSHP